MDYPYYIIDLSNIADFVIRVQYDTEDRKKHGTDKRNRHTGNRPDRRRKAFGGSHNQYRNKRPYKRGYRVHEDGVCRREYGNEDRTARTTSRRKSETETGNGKQRRHKVSYHRKNNHQRRPEGNDSDNSDGNRRKESRNTDNHRSKRGQDRDRRNGTGKEA